MLEPLPTPSPQFCDGNGVPYAGGTITTYVPGTSTLANTWSNLEGTALNTNPIVLDAAGRALIYGAGDYRFVLKDANGNLIWDQETSAIDKTTLVTMAQVNTAVQAETNRAEAAESTLTTNLNAEITRATNAENTLTTDLNNEITRAKNAESNLQSQITGGSAQIIQMGYGSTTSAGTASITFARSYTTYAPAVVATVVGAAFTDTWLSVSPSTTGVNVWASQPVGGSMTGIAIGFYWIAVGT